MTLMRNVAKDLRNLFILTFAICYVAYKWVDENMSEFWKGVYFAIVAEVIAFIIGAALAIL